MVNILSRSLLYELVFKARQVQSRVKLIDLLLLFTVACGGGDDNESKNVVVLAANAYYVDQDDPIASDSNDGRYSADGGTGPWKTLNYAIFNLRAGDVLYIRAGTYIENYPMYLKNDFTNKQKGGNSAIDMNSESGTITNPVEIRNYPDETVEIDLNNVPFWIALDNKSYWIFSGLKFINARAVFDIGEDATTEHNTFKNIEVYRNRGGDNQGAFNILNTNGEYTIIHNCKIIGNWTDPNNLHHNTTGVFVRSVSVFQISNTEIANMPIGIYYKHANNGTDADIRIENNFIYNTTRNAMQVNAVNAMISNNIFGPNNTPVLSSEANGSPGGDGNTYVNNTFYFTHLSLSADTQTGDPNPGSLNNAVIDNLFYESKIEIHNYSTIAHSTTLDYNLYTLATPISEFGMYYSLVDWKAYYGSDQNSLGGSVTFISDATPTNVADFSISGLGQSRDSENKDMGADVTQVGYEENLN